VQIFDRKGLREKSILARFDITVEHGCDNGHHTCLVEQWEVEIAGEMGVLKAKGAIFVDELPTIFFRLVLHGTRFSRKNLALLFRLETSVAGQSQIHFYV
jgi:hypothetical protein